MPSTAIRDIVYDPDSRTLAVTFVTSGRRYRYFDVPREDYEALRHAPSKGAWFNTRIKPLYDYELVYDPSWGERSSRPNSATVAKPYLSPVTRG